MSPRNLNVEIQKIPKVKILCLSLNQSLIEISYQHFAFKLSGDLSLVKGVGPGALHFN